MIILDYFENKFLSELTDENYFDEKNLQDFFDERKSFLSMIEYGIEKKGGCIIGNKVACFKIYKNVSKKC